MLQYNFPLRFSRTESMRSIVWNPQLVAAWHTHPALTRDFLPGIERVNREVDEFFLSLGYRHDRENGQIRAAPRLPRRAHWSIQSRYMPEADAAR